MELRRIVNHTRLATGLTLFAYVVTHLVTHAIGLISLPALVQANELFLAFWRSPPLYWVVPICLVLHAGLALWGLAVRRSLRLKAGELVQLILGLVMPLLLIPHIAAMRGLLVTSNIKLGYRQMFLGDFGTTLGTLWLMVAVVWMHACMGVHFLLRLKSWYYRVYPTLLVSAVLLPIFACLGALNSGREVRRAAMDPVWTQKIFAGIPDLPTIQALARQLWEPWLLTYCAAVALALVARSAIKLMRNRNRIIEIRYEDGTVAKVAEGTTILEASRLAGVAHASICGGKGRCSTCRVRIIAGLDNLAVPALQEQKVLQRIGAPPNVRLACQLRPTGPTLVTPLLRTEKIEDGFARPGYAAGIERDVVVMFADLRGFTSFSERRLPYDVVYILNQYFETMGDAIQKNGGKIDKFIGDGIMAIFGIDTDLPEAARNALRATQAMAERLVTLNKRLTSELSTPLRMGIGLHCGPAIVGYMGHRESRTLTAIGDTTNTASRLENLCRDFDCELIVSKVVIDQSGWTFPAFRVEVVAVRGKNETMEIHPVPIIRDNLDVDSISRDAARA